MTDEQLQKLPKWAREEFQRLERETREAKEHCRKLLDAQTVTNICIDHYEEPKFIQDETVYFRFGEQRVIEVRIKKGLIEVRALGGLADTLSVTPQAGNSLIIRAEAWSDVFTK